MTGFTKGFVCAVAIGIFGKVMYEIGVHRYRQTAKCVERLVNTVSEKNEEAGS